jgi:hypothetical protein
MIKSDLINFTAKSLFFSFYRIMEKAVDAPCLEKVDAQHDSPGADKHEDTNDTEMKDANDMEEDAGVETDRGQNSSQEAMSPNEESSLPLRSLPLPQPCKASWSLIGPEPQYIGVDPADNTQSFDREMYPRQSNGAFEIKYYIFMKFNR